jgi:hypothetical protein
MFTKYLHQGIAFLLGLNLLIFGVKKGFFGVSARLKSILP